MMKGKRIEAHVEFRTKEYIEALSPLDRAALPSAGPGLAEG
jgi:hypothetical protein